jgi:hypothetical protein
MAGQLSSDDVLKPPSGLKSAGRKPWLSVVDKYVLPAAEVEMLGQACRTADELDRLERAVRALPELTTIGSTVDAVRRYGGLDPRRTAAAPHLTC